MGNSDPNHIPIAEASLRQWGAYLHGLTYTQARRFIERMDELQALNPFTGLRLQIRARSVKGRIMYGILGNSAWGRSMQRKRAYYTRLLRGKPLRNRWQRKLDQWRREAAQQ